MLEVRLFGQFEVVRSGSRLTIPTRQAQSLFAYLILNAGKSIRREKLSGLLWPDSAEENARSNLRHELWRLRKALNSVGETYLRTDDLTISFSRGEEFSLDVQQLEQPPVEGSSIEELIQALSVYQDELLPGFYEEWVLVERQRLSALYETKLGHLLELLQSEGRWSEVSEWALRWIAQGGWPEPAYRALMTSYAAMGESSKAVTTYERYTQGLQNELGLKPSDQTQVLYKRIKAGWKPEVAAFAQHEQSARFPEKKPASTPPLPIRRRSNLPKPLTSFIGREKEILQVERLVSRGRLITITGSGGVGKTRLAIQVAGTLSPNFRDGVWWVELASLFVPSSPKLRLPASSLEPTISLVAQAMSKALRIPETPGVSFLEGVVENLNDKQLLLVLDNCEHLIEACASLAERLLGDCPDITILATSREAMGVPGEKTWDLPSLSLPAFWKELKLEDIFHSEAVNLFIKRTEDALPGYQPGELDARTIAHICKRLDGIPLAIELAAARMNLLSAQEISGRLDSRFSLLTGGRRAALPRHQTLLAAIEWSYDLLSEAEQILFRCLSVFNGSFTLEAAEAVCACQEIPRDQVLTMTGRLVNKSLLTVVYPVPDCDQTTRYRLLDTTCSFGRLKSREAKEVEKLRTRHADYYVDLVEAAEPELLSDNQGRWYRLLQADHDNIRAVIEWSVEMDRAECALRVVGALLWFWWSHSSTLEGLDLAQKALALPSSTRLPVYRARALNTAAYMYWVLGNWIVARQAVEESLALLKESNDEATLAWSMQFLGLLLTSEGEYERANKAMDEGVAIAQKLGDISKSCFALAFQGDIALIQGDKTKAFSVYEDCTASLKTLGNTLFMAYPVRRLGHLYLEQDDISRAWKNFQESLSLNQAGGDQRGSAACLTSLAALALRLGHPILAAQLLGCAENKLEAHFASLLYLDQAEYRRVWGGLQEHLDEYTLTQAFEAGWALGEEQAIKMVENILAENNEGLG